MTYYQAKSYWQHTGEIISSRQAEEALKVLGLPAEEITQVLSTILPLIFATEMHHTTYIRSYFVITGRDIQFPMPSRSQSPVIKQHLH